MSPVISAPMPPAASRAGTSAPALALALTPTPANPPVAPDRGPGSGAQAHQLAEHPERVRVRRGSHDPDRHGVVARLAADARGGGGGGEGDGVGRAEHVRRLRPAGDVLEVGGGRGRGPWCPRRGRHRSARRPGRHRRAPTRSPPRWRRRRPRRRAATSAGRAGEPAGSVGSVGSGGCRRRVRGWGRRRGGASTIVRAPRARAPRAGAPGPAAPRSRRRGRRRGRRVRRPALGPLRFLVRVPCPSIPFRNGALPPVGVTMRTGGAPDHE